MGLAYVQNPTTETGYKLYGNGRLFLPAATNYCTNPSFETWTGGPSAAPDGWTNWASDITGTPTWARIPAIGAGSYALNYQYTGVAGDGAGGNKYLMLSSDLTAVGSFASGDIVTLSMTMKGSVVGTPAPILQIYFRDADGSSVAGGNILSSAVTLTTTATRFSVTFTAAPAGTSRARFGWYINGVSQNDTIDITIDDVLVEKSSILTPYGDGSYPGWSWSGAANASTSVREVSALRYANPFAAATLPAAGTLAVRAAPLFTNSASGYATMVSLAAGDTIRAGIYQYNANVWRTLAGGIAVNLASSFSAGTPHVFVDRWDAAGVYANINGVSATGAAPTTGTAADNIAVGARGTDVTQYNGTAYIGPVLISPVNAPDAFVTALQSANGALYSDVVGMVELARRYNLQPFGIIPLQSDSRMFVVTG